LQITKTTPNGIKTHIPIPSRSRFQTDTFPNAIPSI